MQRTKRDGAALWSARIIVVAARQKVIAVRPVIRRRLLKTNQRRGPELHAIEIVLQTGQGLDEVLHKGI
jgi:hypothetical protein